MKIVSIIEEVARMNLVVLVFVLELDECNDDAIIIKLI